MSMFHNRLVLIGLLAVALFVCGGVALAQGGPPGFAQELQGPPPNPDPHLLRGVYMPRVTPTSIPGSQGVSVPFKPEAKALFDKRTAMVNAGVPHDDPQLQCRSGGSIRSLTTTFPVRFIDTPGQITILSEEDHIVRRIYLNQKQPAHVEPSLTGHSVGHWEGDTLVIDTTNFTDQTPYAGAQNLHVIERLTRVDNDTIRYQFTVEDPGMWIKPWSGETSFSKIGGLMYEYACHEANYGLANTLNGARVAEKAAAQKSGGR
jgi:hypothetical protein